MSKICSSCRRDLVKFKVWKNSRSIKKQKMTFRVRKIDKQRNSEEAIFCLTSHRDEEFCGKNKRECCFRESMGESMGECFMECHR